MSDAPEIPPSVAQQSRPKPPTTGVVTFLDVLGWKGIYNREIDPIEKLSVLVNGLVNASKRFRGRDSIPQVRSISDTIVIYSTAVVTADAVRVVDMHGDICAQAIAASIAARIPIRGATAFGDFDVQGSIYVGKAIDEAASWYEAGDWIGVHLTPSAMFTVDSELEYWTEYSPPLKASAGHKTQCVIWLNAWKETVSGHDAKQQLQSVFRDMGPITPDFAMKFINTLAYVDELLHDEKASQTEEGEVPNP